MQQPLQAPPKLSTDIKVERGSAPAAGFAESAEPSRATKPGRDHIAAIAAARQQGHGDCSSFSRQTWVSALSLKIFFAARGAAEASGAARFHGGLLSDERNAGPEFVSGENFRLFSSLKIPRGEGLSGWVAQNHKPILNGNPSVEPGYLNDPTKYSTLRSALAVPLEGASGSGGCAGAVSAGQDAFYRRRTGVVEAIGAGLGVGRREWRSIRRCGRGCCFGARAGS